MHFSRKIRGFVFVFAVLASSILYAPVRAADVNDFAVKSFTADYYLTRNVSNRSQMRVVEKIVATFPQTDQNHGIERAIPDTYDGHTVKLKVRSVKKDASHAWQYTTYGSNDNTVLRIGDADRYVHGDQTYLIEYTLQDVTKGFSDHDELFWDVNGTGWSQPFGSVTARLHLTGRIKDAYTSQTRCFSGREGETDTCEIAEAADGKGIVLTFDAGRMLYARENMSFAVGFDGGTFAAYQSTTWEKLLPVLIICWLALSGLILVVTIGVLVHASRRYGRPPKGRGVIVPEYLPPKDMNVLVAANVLGRMGHATTAQIIDLAVRHYLKIYETETKGNWFRNKRTYELELVKTPNKLSAEEHELLDMVFGTDAQAGQRVTIELLRSKLYKESIVLGKAVKRRAETEGYFADRTHERRRYYWVGGCLLAGSVLLLQPGAFIAGIATLVVASSWRPFTERGVERRDYLKGLKMYMQLAEAERIRQLQSPEGAAKVSIDPTDKKQLIKLYEQLLPYAILFGIEKEWVKEFAPLYDQPPEWYAGNWSTYQSAALVASIGSFTNASNSAFSPPSSSSSSGFSGGSSGGGGGGGGGGGW
jgi:uncharacterized membrane protein YgcG